MLFRSGEEAERGDLVVIYGSGHGSRQAAQAARKSDGLEQLFLPTDAAPGESGGAAFRNAIVSTEFGERLDRIRLKGADVWFILDSCFSGGASREAGGAVRDKSIEAGAIAVGVSSALAPETTTPLAERPALPLGAGRLVAFYASQPNETAREAALPVSLPLAKRAWGSIFTLALAQALERGRGLSYRQTLVEAGRVLRADAAFQSRQTPSFEGDGLDAPAPGAAAAAAASWRVEDGVLRAGALEGVEAGAVLALYETPVAQAALARVVVTEAEPLQARLAMLKDGCDPLAGVCAAQDKPGLPARAAYARLIKPAPGAALRVAPPRAFPGMAEPPHASAARAAMEAAVAGPLAGKIALDEAAPDLIAWLTPAGVRFSPAEIDPAQVESGPGVALDALAQPDRAAAALSRVLSRARQTIALQKLAAASSPGAGLVVTMEARRFGQDGAGKCAFKASGEPIEEGAAAGVCDKVVVSVENQGREASLPMVFFVDDGWNLIARRPACPVGLSVADRLEPGRRLAFEIPYHPRAISAGLAPQTVNGVFVVGAPFRAGEADLPNLCGLTALNDGAGGASRGEADDLDALIGGGRRGARRLELEASAMAFSFWPVRQPLAGK